MEEIPPRRSGEGSVPVDRKGTEKADPAGASGGFARPEQKDRPPAKAA